MFYRVLLFVLSLQMSFFAASAYTMPADKLLVMSNKQLCDKAQSHWNKIELDSALICFNIVANRGDKKQSREEMEFSCRALIAMANIFAPEFYDYERAIQCTLKAERMAMKYNYEEQLVRIYELMATIEGEKNDIQQNFSFSDQAFNLHKKAFHQSVKLDKAERIQVLSIINMITRAFRYNKIDLIQNELQLFQSAIINDTVPARNYAKHQCAAAIYVQKQQYDSALNELNQIETYLDMAEHNRPTYRIVAHENIFFIYRAMNDRVAALKELDIIEQIAQESHDTYLQIEALLLKRDYYAALGNNVLADKYDLEYRKAKDKFIADTKLAKVDEEKVLFKLNEANHEIKELSYKQRIQKTELIAVAVVAVLLLALLVMGWLSHRRTKQKNQSLYDRNQQLLAHVDRLRQIRKDLEQQSMETQTASVTTIKYGRGKMGPDDIAQVMEKVERAMDTSPDIFSTEFSLDQLVELTGETRPRLSQALNEVPDRSFYNILNEYRVREACRRMNDKEHYSGLTIEAIGQSVGFKSRSNFVSTFKRIIGLTPSAYLKQVGSSTVQPSSSKTSDTNQAESW